MLILPRPWTRRIAMTFLDLLIILAMFSILFMLFLPALQQSRERARRVQCTFHLQQIGLACHGYAAAHGTLPPGSTGMVDPLPLEPAPGEAGWSWMVRILPWADQLPLHDALNHPLGPDHSANRTTTRMELDHYACPSAPGQWRPNYAGIHDHRITPIRSGVSGCFPLNQAVRLDDITDGLRHTLLAAEVSNGMPGGWASGGFSTLRVSADSPTPLANRTVRTATGWLSMRLADDLAAGGSFRIGVNYATPAWPEMTGLGSAHEGGMHGLFADGSVRFLSDSLDAALWRAHGTRAGRELIGDG
jgi:prepilin-type processing-associated H-X9-DG protein